MKLLHVLHRAQTVKVHLQNYDVVKLKNAAHFWVGKEARPFNKQATIAALQKAMDDPTAVAAACGKLNQDEKLVLAVVARYGTTVSGDVLRAELIARNLIAAPRPGQAWHQDDIVSRLRDISLLVARGGQPYYSTYHSGPTYPELTLHSALCEKVPPAAPLHWKPATRLSDVQSTLLRSSAEVALDLWHVAEALREMKSWQLVQGYMLSKGSRNKLEKLVGLNSAKQDPLSPPEPHSLYYEILRRLDCLDVATETINASSSSKLAQQIAPIQAWNWVRAWLETTLWQDGLGVVPDREGAPRISPYILLKSKALLVWSLCRVADRSVDWIDLEEYLKGFWSATRNDYASFYWGTYSWNPGFKLKAFGDKDDQRLFSFWVQKEGSWAANAIMVTLVTLGLVERGKTKGDSPRHCFRLSDLGRTVFGSAEIEAPRETGKERFLTVQPNHEVLAYLDAADASQVAMLARFAERGSAAGGRVQTFALRRETVYRGLESGLTSESIQQFLAERCRTPVPHNVSRSISEWSKKRESLILRRHVTLALSADFSRLPADHSSARMLGPTSAVLPSMNAKQAQDRFTDWKVVDHAARAPATGKGDERGNIRIEELDSVARLLFSRIADLSDEGWQINRQSIARARKLGMSLEQILFELRLRLAHDIPPLLETAISNWASRAPAVFVGKVLMLHVPSPDACRAILSSKAFKPLVAGHLPPNWFFIRDDHLAETKRLLRDLGFSLSDFSQPPAGEVVHDAASASKSPSRKRSRK